MNKLAKMYPSINPPTTLTDIPKTYHSNDITHFIIKNNKILGVVNKYGDINRVLKPIKTNKDLPIVQDPFNVLHSVLHFYPKIDDIMQKNIEKQINMPFKNKNKILIYNPINNDFIPINEILSNSQQLDIINNINTHLISKTLPSISHSIKLAGLIVNENNVIGIITTDNEIKKFEEPIKLVEPKFNDELQDIIIDNSDVSSLYSNSDIESDSGYIEKEIIKEVEIPAKEVSEPLVEMLDKEPSVEMPIEMPVEMPVETPSIETPVEMPVEIPIETPVETPVEIPIETPVETPVETQVETPVEMPIEMPIEKPSIEMPVETPVESSIEDKENLELNEINKELIKTLPKLIIEDDKSELKSDLDGATIMSKVQINDILGQLRCLEGEQYDITKNRCVPCNMYNLEWDSKLKKCKINLNKENIIPLNNNKNQFDMPVLVMDENDNIIGFSENK